MRIKCPHCGPRGLEEFLCHGEAMRKRPADGGAAPTQAWTDFVYIRENPNGTHKEFWYHHAGCRAWLLVNRDLSTHEILSVRQA